MNTPTPPIIDHRSEVLKKLAELALRKTALKQILAPYQTQIASIEAACTVATAEEATAIEHLEEWLKEMALRHGVEIFGKESRSLTQGLFTLGLRDVEKVEVCGDEAEVISALQKAAKSHPDDATRLAAAACLRIKVAINKEFVRENWELFSPWFIIFGLKLVESESASIAEKKPAKPKAAKPLKKGKKGEETQDGREAA